MKKAFLKSMMIVIILNQAITSFAQNMAVGLNGSGSVLVGNKPEYNFTGSFTIEAKALLDTMNIIANPRVISKGNVHFGFTGFMLYYMWGSANPNNPKGYRFALCCNPSNVEVETPEVSYCEFNHIAVAYDSAVSKVRIYANGIVMDSAAISSPLKLNTKDVRIGTGDGGDNWFGKIDEVRIWNHPRSASQLVALMNDTLPPAYYATADSGLIGYWRMDEAADLGAGVTGANDVKDYSASGNHGDMEGDAGIVNDSDGCVSPQVGIAMTPINFPGISVYPNPFTASALVKAGSPIHELMLHNLLGEKILSARPLGLEYEIKKADLLPGIYFLKLRTKDHFITQKIIIQ